MEKQQQAPTVKHELTRGICPCCGNDVVTNTYYVSNRGYLIFWECLSSIADVPTCDYRRVL